MLIAATPLASGCFTYTSAGTAPVAPGTRVALVLNDQGRVGLSQRVGPEIARLDGALVEKSDSAYTIRVRKITDLSGSEQLWSDETIAVRPEFLKVVTVRQFSRSRTLLAVGATGLAVGAFAVGRSLIASGIENDDPGDPGDPGNTRRTAPVTLFRFSF